MDQSLVFFTIQIEGAAVGDVALGNTVDITHRLLAYAAGGHLFHVIAPDIGIESLASGLAAQLDNAIGAGIVRREGEQVTVQLVQFLVVEVVVEHIAHVLGTGMDIVIHLADIADIV